MQKCILCQSSPLPDKKPEHVLLNAMGGRKVTHKAICGTCNEAVGSGPDTALARSADTIRNLMNYESGDGDPAPTIRGIEVDGDRYILKPGGIPVLVSGGKALDFDKSTDRIDVSVKARDAGHLNRLVPNIAKALSVSEEKARAILLDGNYCRQTRRAPSMPMNIEFGGQNAIRSMAKSCLVLWALKVGTEEIHDERYDLVRNFIVSGGKELNTALVEMDTRPLEDYVKFDDSYGQNYNVIYIASNEDGRVFGYFRFYGLIAWRIELCNSGAPVKNSIGLISNPAHPSIWTDEVATQTPISFSWIESASYDDNGQDVRKAVATLLARYQERSSKDEVGRLTTQALEDQNIIEGDRISEEWIADIAERLTRFAMRMPHDRLLSRDSIAKYLKVDEPERDM